MTFDELVDSVAYCGLVCGLCRHATDGGCTGCTIGGGADQCHQRDCCVEKGFDGCWDCPSFPCEKGFYADDAWRGLCIGSVRCIKENGIVGFVGRAASRFGLSVEYGDYRLKNEREIGALLFGDPCKEAGLPRDSNPTRAS